MGQFRFDDEGCVNGINKSFTWNGMDYKRIVPYVMWLASNSERRNFARFTNVREFLHRINMSM